MGRLRPQFASELRRQNLIQTLRKAPNTSAHEILSALALTLPADHPVRWLVSSVQTDQHALAPEFSFLIASGNRDYFQQPGQVMWRDRRGHPYLRDLSPPDFATRVYGDRFHPDFGMTFAELGVADGALRVAINNWLHQPIDKDTSLLNRLPADFGLLTREAATSAKVRLLNASGILRYAATVSALKHRRRSAGTLRP